jgi:Skp family chaperone for outer membrane proteins
MAKITEKLTNIVDETNHKAQKDIECLKNIHEEKLHKLEEEVQAVHQELDKKNIELNKYTNECKLMEDEIARIKKGNLQIDDSNTSKLLILEKNLESTFQKLVHHQYLDSKV